MKIQLANQQYPLFIIIPVSIFLLSSCGSSEKDTAVVNNEQENPTPIVEIDNTITENNLTTLTTTSNLTASFLTLDWNDANAAHYRVLYWDPEGALTQWETNHQTQTIALSNVTNGGQILVEGYDSLGNSIFSAPISLEAQ